MIVLHNKRVAWPMEGRIADWYAMRIYLPPPGWEVSRATRVGLFTMKEWYQGDWYQGDFGEYRKKVAQHKLGRRGPLAIGGYGVR